ATARPTGGGSLSYQCRKDGADITGKTGSSLVINPVAADDVGMYTVLVTNTIGGVPPASTLSSAASLNVAPVITVQPASTAAAVGTGATFSVIATVSGTATISYQWRKGTT